MINNHIITPPASGRTQRSHSGRLFQGHTLSKGKGLNDFSTFFTPIFRAGRNVRMGFLLAVCLLTALNTWGQFVRVGVATSPSLNCYQLTPEIGDAAGAIWYQSKINLNFNVHIAGTLNFGNIDANGADGIGFVLQPVSNGIGAIGGGLGFQGINPSLGVEFDTYQNSDFGDPYDDHIALVKNGVLNHNAPENLQGPFILPNLENGANHAFVIDWNATTKNLQVILDGTLRINYTSDIVNNLFSSSPFVFWGFTAATGASYNFQTVCLTNYTFIQDPSLTWTNTNGNTLWNTPGNWTGNTVPSSEDDVVFNAATPSDVDIDIDPTIKSLEVNPDYNGVIKLGSKTLSIKNGMKVSKFGSFNAGTGKVKLIGGQKVSVKSPLHKVEIDAPDSETITLEEDLTVRDRLDIKSIIALKKAALIATVLQRKIKVQGAVSIQAPMSPSTDVVISMNGESDQDFNSVGGAIIEVDKPTPTSQTKLIANSAVKKMDILKGLLNLNKNKLTSAEQVKILQGGKVAGKGKVAAPSVKAQKGSKIAPGNSPGLMTIEGDLIMESEAVLEYEITATEHDVLEVQGTVSIDKAILEIQATGTPTFSVIMVIDNDGTDPVSGTFAGLREGSLVTIAGNSYRISYVGGTGNDVTLSDNVAPIISCPNPLLSINTNSGVCTAIGTFNSATATDNFSTILAPIAGFRLLGTIGHHAYYLSDASMVYSAALADAYARGGHLVTLANAAENTLVTTGYWTWIGLNDLASTNNYAWITNEPLTYTNWESGEPNNVGAEHNGMLFPNGKWNNSNDVIAIQYILELENVLTITQTAGLASGSTFPLGPNNIVFTATDAAGNTSSCSITVTVTDNQKPSITCPANQSINLNSSCNGTLPDYTGLLTVSDNCTAAASLVVTQIPAANTPLSNKGSAIVTFTVKDQSNNSSSCTISVEKKDVTAPTISCPSSITKTNDVGNCSAVATFPQPTATDNCTSVSYTNFYGGEPNQAGVENHLQLYLFNNGSGSFGKWNDVNMNNLYASIVEVNVNTLASQIGYSLLGSFGGHTYYYKSTAQTWSAARSSAQSIGGDLVSINTPEENQFIVASAPNGGSAWVGGYQDSTDPDYAEPGNASQNYGGWKWVDGTRFGKGRVTITQTSGKSSGSVFSVGTTTNIFTATDEAGNLSWCSFNVTVTDNEKPTITPPSGIVTCSDGNIAIALGTPTRGDNCGVATVGNDAPAMFSVGTTLVTWTVTDVNNNTEIATQTVVVNANTTATQTETACDNYTWALNGTTYTTSGVYTCNTINALGCTQVNTLNLTINISTTHTTTVTACTSYTWSGPLGNGATYTTSGTHTFVSTNAAGCPHTETLVLTINPIIAQVETNCLSVIYGYGSNCTNLVASATGGNGGLSYTWNPGNLTGATVQVCPTTTTTYTVTIKDALQCTVTKTVTVNVLDVRCGNKNDKVQICHNGNVLCVAASAIQAHLAHGDKLGTCQATTPCGSNASMVQFNDNTGNKAQTVHKNGDEELGTDLIIYPNPAHSEAWINLKGFEGQNVNLVIINMLGETVAQTFIKQATSEAYRLDIAPLSTGLYYIKVQAQGKEGVIKKLQVTK